MFMSGVGICCTAVDLQQESTPYQDMGFYNPGMIFLWQDYDVLNQNNQNVPLKEPILMPHADQW